jgi:DNA polymerase-3 subunit gamma/tau
MSHEFHKRYRPNTIEGVIGQDDAIATLKKFMAKGTVPHTILFSGPSGVGKTTLARILKNFLGCSKSDFREINSADFKGVDTVRDIRSRINMSALGGKCRIYLIDECHKMTNDAQNAFLKILEDTPDHVYFFLATTDPQKLISAILTRAKEVRLRPIDSHHLQHLVEYVIAKEKLKVCEEVIEEIADAAEGSARKALVILEDVSQVDGKEAQLKAIQRTTVNKDLAFKLAQMVVYKKGSWNEIAHALRSVENDDAEGIRQIILGLARSLLIGAKSGGAPSNPRRGAVIIEIFGQNLYTEKHAGLAYMCYNASNQK